MEKKKKTKIRKWDEVGGAVETEIDEIAGSFEETPGAGPSVRYFSSLDEQIIITGNPEALPFDIINNTNVNKIVLEDR